MKKLGTGRVVVEYSPGGAGSIAGFIVTPKSATNRSQRAAVSMWQMLQGKKWKRMVLRGVYARKLQAHNKKYCVRLAPAQFTTGEHMDYVSPF